MTHQLSIALILGTGREGRASENVARYVEVAAKAYGFHITFVDVRDYATSVTLGPSGDTPKIREWKDVIIKADALLIVTPEYNHGYPGELKMLLDTLKGECNRKPAALCGVSKGVYGGARVVENLHPVLIDLSIVPIRAAVYFANARELFDTSGAILDPSYGEKLKKQFDELAWYAHVLKTARESVS